MYRLTGKKHEWNQIANYKTVIKNKILQKQKSRPANFTNDFY